MPARGLLQEIVAERFDEGDRHALLGERQRQAQTDRPGADDNDALERADHGREQRTRSSGLSNHILGGAGPAGVGEIEHDTVGVLVFRFVK